MNEIGQFLNDHFFALLSVAVVFVLWVTRGKPAPSPLESWLHDVQENQIGKGVAVKFRSGPEVYMGTLTAISFSEIRLTTDQGIDLTFYATPSDIQVWGKYDQDEVRRIAAQQQANHMMNHLINFGGSDVTH